MSWNENKEVIHGAQASPKFYVQCFKQTTLVASTHRSVLVFATGGWTNIQPGLLLNTCTDIFAYVNKKEGRSIKLMLLVFSSSSSSSSFLFFLFFFFLHFFLLLFSSLLLTVVGNFEDDGFKAKVVLYLYGVVASIRGTDFVNGDVAGDGIDSEGVPAVDVQLVTGHCLRHVVCRTVEVEAKGVGQREGQQVQRQVHGATLVVDGGRGRS